MKGPIEVGMQAQMNWTIDASMCTQRGQFFIFSTPSMLSLVERASISILDPMLETGEASVGIGASIRHLAPTPLGMTVLATATVKAFDRRRITFDVEIRDDVDIVGQAEHDRFVIDLIQYEARLREKVAAINSRRP